MQCLAYATCLIINKRFAHLVEYLGHDGLNRGFNLFEIIDYILQHTDYKPVLVERNVYLNDKPVSSNLTDKYFDADVPKIVLVADPVPHAIAMFRDGSMTDIKIKRSFTDEEADYVRKNHMGLMLFYK